MSEVIWIIPFGLLLGCIAVVPLFNKHWWEKNYPLVSLSLGSLVALHYIVGLRDVHPLLEVAHEYVSFVALVGALFVVSGGIHITVKGEATPLTNSLFLLTGGVLANLLGTTGASVILIRPWLRTNKHRLAPFHVIFFIFVVSNIGGALTPIGDPPLFLGYLQGIPFFWVMEHVWGIWLLTLALVLGIFFMLDQRNYLESKKKIRNLDKYMHEEWKFEGLHNIGFLAMIIGSVFINHPPFLREFMMVLAAVLSYKTTPKKVHASNDFNFAPIQEVAILFAGIFTTMIPALHWLEHNAEVLGFSTVDQFYWGTGILSSVLDNAPTYLNFLSAATGLFFKSGGHDAVQMLLVQRPHYVEAISVASVFFGAVTYIGNGPNFLVKAIADQAGVKTPSFFGYVFRYSLPVLIPVFTLVWLLFFRGQAA